MFCTTQQLFWSVLALAAGVACWLLLQWISQRSVPGGLKPFSSMPAPPQTFLVGNLLDILKGERLQFHRVLHDWAEQLGSPFRYNVLGRWKIVITDPVLLPAVLGRPGLPKSPLYREFRSLVGRGGDILFTRLHLADPHWKGPRKTLARAFSAEEIRKKFGATVDASLALAAQLAALPPGAAVEAQDAMHRVTLDVTLTAGFGISSNGVALFGQPVPLLEKLHWTQADASKRVINPLLNTYRALLPFLPGARESRRQHEELYKIYEGLLDQMEATGPVADDDNSMWGCLKRIEDPDTGKLRSREKLCPEKAGIVLGALDTTSQTCAITLGLLAGHPEAQARMATELDARGLLATPGNPTPRRVEYADIAQLPYMDAVLRESLRVLPVSATGMQRMTPRDALFTDIGGYAVPPNTEVMVLIYGLHHNRKYWDAPEAFRPERWLAQAPAAEAAPEAAAKADGPGAPPAAQGASEVRGTKWTSAAAGERDGRKAAFLPFSGGPVDCLGQRLAMMEAPVILASLLGRFEVELDESMGGAAGMLARQTNMFTISIDQGLHIKFKLRAGWRPEPLRSEE